MAASVLGGVSPGEQRAARGDRGTNVTIPYARVVFHAGATTALPRVKKDMTSTILRGLNGVMPSTHSISETDYLGAGTVGFVLGRRGTGYDADVAAVMGLDTQEGTANRLFSRDQDRLAQFALVGGGVDTNTAQRMCSIEYLDSYFFYVLRKKVVDVGAGIGADESKYISRRYKQDDGPRNVPLTGLTPSGFDASAAAGVIMGTGASTAATTLFATNAKTQGVFAGDFGPFLRGYTIDHRRVNGKTLATGFGDQIAFDVLQQRLMKAGLCDWTPDGIVHSKLSSGDASADYEMDSRDGQLFNVVVKGSAIAVSWTHDRYRDIMPGDQLFLVLVGDVWTSKTADKVDLKATAGGLWADADKYNDEVTKAMGEADKARNDYLTATANAKNTLIGELKTAQGLRNALAPTSTPADIQAADKAFTDAQTKFDAAFVTALTDLTTEKAEVQITNVRPRLITSTEMMQYSAVTKAINEADRTSRLGLRASERCSEYIIGGWSIGNVVDNSASRPIENRSALGVAKRTKTSHACNVLVNVRWWSADRMYRNFMNKEGALRSRFDGSKKVMQNPLNKPASKR
ncbi:hypothetical protein N9S30_00365 [bacterium]|nr:hypothetical protein [bacterium]